MNDGTDRAMRETVAELVCLVYHEARNVRHLIRAGKIPNTQRFHTLTSLPTDKYAAWGQMRKDRLAAGNKNSIAALVRVFSKKYGIELEDLVELYQHPSWRHSRLGGNRWADITATVVKLVEATEKGERFAANQKVEELLSARHNTGTVRDKLSDLRDQLREILPPEGSNAG